MVDKIKTMQLLYTTPPEAPALFISVRGGVTFVKWPSPTIEEFGELVLPDGWCLTTKVGNGGVIEVWVAPLEARDPLTLPATPTA